ncbi:hypothetical protein Q5P01_019904 [Channa striata]|uniref:Uncharacterized protein n=1 Tax=Channa striata TaxID=64152 RepID=A0AA88M1S9_CHASR|nr:hypothetical protein Q5P01_019904 [Channa striata]
MNLFCFTLDGSTESIYEPACSQTLKDVIPKYQCSPALLRRKPECGGSDPFISSERPQNVFKFKRSSRWSCVETSPLENETSEKDINHSCWSLGDKKDLCHTQNREMCKTLCENRRMTKDDRTQTDLATQHSETASDTAESIQTRGRLKKLPNLMQAKKRRRGRAAKERNPSESVSPEVLSNSNPVLTCINLGRRTVKPWKTISPPQQLQAKNREESEEEDAWRSGAAAPLWNPFECPRPCALFYHSCHQARHELWVCGGTLSLPRVTEWDRFESLVQELDYRHCNPSPPQLIRSITDLQLSQNPLTRFGRFDVFRQHSALMKPQDNGSCWQEQEQDGDQTKVGLQGKQLEAAPQSDRKSVKTSPERTLTAVTNGNTHLREASRRETGSERPFTKGHRQSTNSLDSLYSLKSGQSSSSGVTSGSDCSSTRGSLRLEDDLLNTRQFCGRARVHTDHVPSPYDTESLKLKVGDVIDIISKPPMGIWTGMLNGRRGNFKFIYVDVLTEESPETCSQRVRHKSTIQEVLKRLSLEEYYSSLQLHGYQTVDDLMGLKEHHLPELSVTDPEHKCRLLAAVESLQQLRSDSHMENEVNQDAETPSENMKADMKSYPRDSSCHMPSDSRDKHTDHRHHPFPSEHPLRAEMTAS